MDYTTEQSILIHCPFDSHKVLLRFYPIVVGEKGGKVGFWEEEKLNLDVSCHQANGN